jgi:hypothetical protein
MKEEELLSKLKEYMIPKIRKHPIKGRPYTISNETIIEGIYHVLKNGVTWRIASKLVSGRYSLTSSLNRIYNDLVNDGVITDVFNEVINEYKNKNIITDVLMDSMDILNGNCNKNEVYQSYKLHKQAGRLSIASTTDRIPIGYRTDPARRNDYDLGYQLAKELHIDDGEIHNLVGDGGYRMNKDKKDDLLKNHKLRLIVPKGTKNRRKRKPTQKPKQKPKRKRAKKRIRYSKQMKDALKKRIRIEHVNNILHRSFKRLHTIYDKSLKTFNRFVELAIICMIIRSGKLNK